MNDLRALTLAGGFMMMMAVGLGCFFFGVENPKQHALEGPQARMTGGTIIDLVTEQSGRYTGYRADIDYHDDHGGAHRLSAYYPYEAFGTLRPQMSVSVRYLAADPGYAIASGSYKARRDPRIFLLIDSGLFVFGAALFALPRIVRR